APDALDVFQQQVDDIVLVASGLARGVRRDQRVVERPQRRGGGQRLLHGAVDARRGDALPRERGNQRRLVDHPPPRNVDQNRRRFHRGKRLYADQPLGLRRERAGQGDDVGRRQKFEQAVV